MLRKRYWLTVAAVAVVVALYAYHRDLSGLYREYLRQDGEVQALRDQLDQLRSSEEAMTRRVDRLKTDDVEMEAAIRRDKNLVRQGERIYRVELPPEIEADDARPGR